MYRSLGSANFLPILTALVVGYFFLEAPWRWLILIPAVVIDCLDIVIWLRWRKRKSMSGTGSMIGATGEVVELLEGGDEVTVKVSGRLWKAKPAGNLVPGEQISVTGMDGIQLRVTPVDTLPGGP